MTMDKMSAPFKLVAYAVAAFVLPGKLKLIQVALIAWNVIEAKGK